MIISSKKGFVEKGTIKTIVTGKGFILGLIMSHEHMRTREVNIYDNYVTGINLLMKIKVSTGCSPVKLSFTGNEKVYFGIGLTVDAGDCDVFVIAETI